MNKGQVSISNKQNTLSIIASSVIHNKVIWAKVSLEFDDAQSIEKLMNYHDHLHYWTLFEYDT